MKSIPDTGRRVDQYQDLLARAIDQGVGVTSVFMSLNLVACCPGRDAECNSDPSFGLFLFTMFLSA